MLQWQIVDRRGIFLLGMLGVSALLWSCARAGVVVTGSSEEIAGEELAQHLVERIGVSRGLCAVVGDSAVARHIAGASDLLIHAVESDGSVLEARRKGLDAAGLYGRRATVEKGSLQRLPYADNLIDAVVCVSLSDQLLNDLSLAEVLRVLRPGGVAILGQRAHTQVPQSALSEARLQHWLADSGGRVTRNAFGLWAEVRKPFPVGTDDWTHWQHGPDNNPVSLDRVIKAPYMTQFLATPWFSTMPSISTICQGTMFRAAGHMAIHEREERYLNTLYATNAYNGTLLWTRPVPTGFLTHCSLFVATPDTLYLIEPERCLLLDPETGAEKGQIVLSPEVTQDRYWKWIAFDDGLLYALLGGPDYEAEVIRRKRRTGSWGWNELSKGYYEKPYPWGSGHTLVAVDPSTQEVLWVHREEAPIDSRALCLGNGRLFLHSEGSFVACLDARSGGLLWRNSDPDLLGVISSAFDKGLGFKTTPYTICTEDALYFGGRGRKNVVAVSAEDGRHLWDHPGAYNATNLLFRGGHLYAHVRSCKVFEPLTGEVVGDLGIEKRSCARFTGCPDSLFHRGSIRGGEGTTRYDLARNQPTVIHAFRPACNDGIIPAGGLLHITPWDCDCNLQLMGSIALCPAGSFQFNREASEAERRESFIVLADSREFSASPDDWKTYRADNYRSSATPVMLPERLSKQWEFQPKVAFAPSPPTAVGGLVFLGGDDGIVRAIDVETGALRWKFYTGGPVRVPPTIDKDGVYFGSADGYVYCLDAATGQLFWRFRAAPVERRIMVFGALCSTWPVNSGVLLHEGVAYAAAGIINYDGTHVYALDAATGRIKWQNNTSGHLNEDLREGVSAQGDIALLGDRLLLAGGNVASPGIYGLSDGKCLNNAPRPGWPGGNQGSMVCGFLGKYPMVGGRRLFTQEDDPITNWKPFDIQAPDNFRKKLKSAFVGRIAPAFGHGVVATSARGGPLVCLEVEMVETWINTPETDDRQRNPQSELLRRWEADSLHGCVAIVVAPNAVVAAGQDRATGQWCVKAFDLEDGKQLWAEPMPGPPVANGLCVDGAGRVISVLEGGRVVCLADK